MVYIIFVEYIIVNIRQQREWLGSEPKKAFTQLSGNQKGNDISGMIFQIVRSIHTW